MDIICIVSSLGSKRPYAPVFLFFDFILVSCNSIAMRRDQSLKHFPKDYVVLDIETTGLSAVKNEIIELSALRVENGQVKEEFSSLVKPIGYLSPFISKLTGITQKMLSDAPDIDDALLHFMEFISNSVVIGHNVTFDINFISQKLKECHNVSFENDYIDTLKLARKFLPKLPSKKLGLIAAHFNLNTDGMHRGLKDCVVTNLCYQKFVLMHEQKDKLRQSSTAF